MCCEGVSCTSGYERVFARGEVMRGCVNNSIVSFRCKRSKNDLGEEGVRERYESAHLGVS